MAKRTYKPWHLVASFALGVVIVFGISAAGLGQGRLFYQNKSQCDGLNEVGILMSMFDEYTNSVNWTDFSQSFTGFTGGWTEFTNHWTEYTGAMTAYTGSFTNFTIEYAEALEAARQRCEKTLPKFSTTRKTR